MSSHPSVSTPYRIDSNNSREVYETALREVREADERLRQVIKDKLVIPEGASKEEIKKRKDILAEINYPNTASYILRPNRDGKPQGKDTKVYRDSQENIEGPYYVEFEGNRLRVHNRSASYSHIYLTNDQNFLMIEIKNGIPLLVRMNRFNITESEEGGLKGLSNAQEEEHLEARIKYRTEREGAVNTVRHFVGKKMGIKKYTESKEPEPPTAETIRYSDAVKLLKLMAEGISRIAEAIEISEDAA
jgi:hypothetical protein